MGGNPLSNEEIVAVVVDAFRPFCCCAKIDDYEEKLKVRVYRRQDQGDLCKVPGQPLDPLRDERNLETYLLNLRDLIQAKGESLEPWSFPHDNP